MRTAVFMSPPHPIWRASVDPRGVIALKVPPRSHWRGSPGSARWLAVADLRAAGAPASRGARHRRRPAAVHWGHSDSTVTTPSPKSSPRSGPPARRPAPRLPQAGTRRRPHGGPAAGCFRRGPQPGADRTTASAPTGARVGRRRLPESLPGLKSSFASPVPSRSAANDGRGAPRRSELTAQFQPDPQARRFGTVVGGPGQDDAGDRRSGDRGVCPTGCRQLDTNSPGDQTAHAVPDPDHRRPRRDLLQVPGRRRRFCDRCPDRWDSAISQTSRVGTSTGARFRADAARLVQPVQRQDARGAGPGPGPGVRRCSPCQPSSGAMYPDGTLLKPLVEQARAACAPRAGGPRPTRSRARTAATARHRDRRCRSPPPAPTARGSGGTLTPPAPVIGARLAAGAGSANSPAVWVIRTEPQPSASAITSAARVSSSDIRLAGPPRRPGSHHAPRRLEAGMPAAARPGNRTGADRPRGITRHREPVPRLVATRPVRPWRPPATPRAGPGIKGRALAESAGGPEPDGREQEHQQIEESSVFEPIGRPAART